MSDQYFMIHSSDGDTTVNPLTKEKVLKYASESENYEFLDKIPNNNDTNYWGERSVLIIKGEIVVPKAKEVTTKYDID